METISHEGERILDDFLGQTGASEVAENETIRSHIIATRFKRDRGRDRGEAGAGNTERREAELAEYHHVRQRDVDQHTDDVAGHYHAGATNAGEIG